MVKKSVGRQILWAGEMVVSLRVLLFSIPVMINKYDLHTFSLTRLDDRYIAVISLTAIIYFIVGLVSFTGFRFWKAVHYLAVVLIGVLTFGSLMMANRLSPSVGAYYYVPLLCSVIVAVLAGASKEIKRAS